MSYFGTVSSLLQSVDSHDLWGGFTVGLPSALGSGARRRAQGRGSSEISRRPQTTREVPCTARAVGLSYIVWGACETQKISGAPCMSYFGTVSSLLQSVDSHDLWGGFTVGLPSALGSGARRRAQGRGSSEIEPCYAVRPLPSSPVCRCWK